MCTAKCTVFWEKMYSFLRKIVQFFAIKKLECTVFSEKVDGHPTYKGKYFGPKICGPGAKRNTLDQKFANLERSERMWKFSNILRQAEWHRPTLSRAKPFSRLEPSEVKVDENFPKSEKTRKGDEHFSKLKETCAKPVQNLLININSLKFFNERRLAILVFCS